MQNIENKIQSYESFVDKLKRDLQEVESVLEKKVSHYRCWLDLKNTIYHLRKCETDDEIVGTFPFGQNIYMMAKLEEEDKIIVNIGCNCCLEMSYEEAQKYSDIRMKFSKKEIDHWRNQAVTIKSHLKLVLLAIYEIRNTVK